MAKRRTSIIWDIPSKDFQELLEGSNSIAEILTKIGLPAYNGNHKTINHRIKEEGFDITKLNENRKKKQKISFRNKIPLNDLLKKNSTYSTKNLKNRILAENLINYTCSECGLGDMWNNKPISLQLDHINGINNDNRLENLRILCPNCHTQTPTFSGKHRKKIKFCVDCGVTVSNYSTRCNKCASIAYGKTIRRFEISKENLENLIHKNPMTTVGKMLGVSDNAIRARCRKLGIELKSGL